MTPMALVECLIKKGIPEKKAIRLVQTEYMNWAWGKQYVDND